MSIYADVYGPVAVSDINFVTYRRSRLDESNGGNTTIMVRIVLMAGMPHSMNCIGIVLHS